MGLQNQKTWFNMGGGKEDFLEEAAFMDKFQGKLQKRNLLY